MSEPAGRAEKLFLVVFDLLAGGLKLLAILAPLWLPLLLIFGDSNCRGDCGVGMGMLFLGLLGIAAALGPILLLVGVPLAAFPLYRWTRGRPMQLVGAVAFIPLLISGNWAFNAIRNGIGSHEIRAAMQPEYLSRAVAKPVGQLNHLVMLGAGSFSCSQDCQFVLVNGFASKFSNGYLEQNQRNGIFERVYAASRGPECLSKDQDMLSDIYDLQSNGIFDLCIVKSTPNRSLTATLLRGQHSDHAIRPNGLRVVAALQPIEGEVLGGELIRWEFGSLPGSSELLGSSFQWADLLRAYTGISSDRFGDAQKRDHSQKIDEIWSAPGVPRLQLYAVFVYLQSTLDFHRFSHAKLGLRQKLSPDDVKKLKAIGAKICATTPIVKDNQKKPQDCTTVFNHFVQKNYPAQAGDLVLTLR